MSEQNFLSNSLDKVRRLIAGDDYLDIDTKRSTPRKQVIGEGQMRRDRIMRSHRVGQQMPPGTRMPDGYRSLHSPFQQTPSAPSASTVNSSPISSPINPKPTGPTPRVRPTGNRGGGRLQGAGGLFGALTTGAQIGTQMRDTMPQSTFVSGRGGGLRATNNPRRNSPDPEFTTTSVSNKSNNAADINKRLDQQKAEKDAALKVTKGDYDHSSGGFTDQIVPKVPTRDQPAPNGGSGSGTQTSPGGGMTTLTAATVAQFLQNQKIGLGAFSSIQLPGSPTNPNSGGTIEAQPFSGQETSVTKNTLGAFSATDGQAYPALDPSVFTTKMPASLTSQFSQFGGMALGNGADTVAPSSTAQGGKSYTEIKPNDPMFAKAFGQDLADKQTKGNTSRLNAALNDTAGMRSYMSKFGSPEQDKRRAADMAFLNTSGSQEGLRAKEAVFGQIHASGQTYQLNDAGTELLQGKNGKPLAMDPKAASSYRLGTSTAEDYKNSYKGKVKEIMPATPKQAEAPSAQNPEAVTEQPTAIQREPLMRQTVDPNIIENYDFTKPGAEEAYFGPGGILEKATKR